ncbi:MAG: IclR family transcriptional regulator [Pseudomonadota bacterium]
MRDDPYLVPGLLRGLAALRAFTPDRTEMTLNEIATAVGVSKSAVFRTVHTLAEAGYLLPVQNNAAYKLGPAVVRLAYGYHAGRELLEAATPTLEALRDHIDWSTHLGVLDGRQILYLLRFAATGGLTSLVHVGSRLPAASTSMGRLLLCHKSPEFIQRLYAEAEPGTAAHVLHRRDQDAEREVVVSVGNFESGLCSVAAPVHDISGDVVAAISVTRMCDAVPDPVIDEVCKSARRISELLGAVV